MKNSALVATGGCARHCSFCPPSNSLSPAKVWPVETKSTTSSDPRPRHSPVSHPTTPSHSLTHSHTTRPRDHAHTHTRTHAHAHPPSHASTSAVFFVFRNCEKTERRPTRPHAHRPSPLSPSLSHPPSASAFTHTLDFLQTLRQPRKGYCLRLTNLRQIVSVSTVFL